MAADSHPSNEELMAFDRGALPSARQEAVEQHVAVCADCCLKLESVPEDRLVALLRNLPCPETRDWRGETPVAGLVGRTDLPVELRDHPRYRVFQLLGEGGMGAVYKAQHLLMERAVALKIIRVDLTERPHVVERFRQEVKAAAQLSDPHIVAAYDAEQAGNVHFLVMEYVAGETLDRIVSRAGPLPLARACDYVCQAARGLQHAHERGMVHRDIKPANLIVTRGANRSDLLKILDFGLARLVSGAAANPLTHPNAVLGTPDFMAPEQALRPSQADIRADLYSLGCTLYYLLTARLPFPDGTPMQKLLARKEQQPIPIQSQRPGLPARFITVLDRMLSADPAERFQTPHEMIAALQPFAADPALSQSRWTKRRLALLAVPLLLLLALAIAFRAKTDKGKVTPAPDARPAAAIVVEEPVVASPEQLKVVRSATDFRSVAFAHDGRRAFSIAPDNSLQAWDLLEGKKIRDLPAGLEREEVVCCSANGDRLAVGGVHDAIKVWQPSARQPLQTLRSPAGHQGALTAASFALDSQHLLTASSNHNLVMWKVGESRVMHTYRGHEAAVTDLHVGRGGRYAVSASLDGNVCAWDLQEGKAAFRFPLGSPVTAVTLSRRGYYLLSGSADHSIRLWRFTTQRELRRFHGHTGKVLTVALSPDNRWALSGSVDGTVRLWDLDSAQQLCCFRGHRGSVLKVAFSDDGKQALSAGGDGTFRFWRLPTTTTAPPDTVRFSEKINATFMSPDGKRTLIARGDERVEFHENKDEVTRLVGHTDAVTVLDMAKDNKVAATGGWDQRVCVWQLDTPPEAGTHAPALTLKGHKACVTALAMRGHYLFIASGDANGVVKLWDRKTGAERAEFQAHEGAVRSILFLPQCLASGGDDGKIRFWDLSMPLSGEFPSKVFAAHDGPIHALANTDGQLLISAGADHAVKVWRAGFWRILRLDKPLLTLRHHEGTVRALAIGPDGQTLASAGDDRTIHLVDVRSGARLKTLRGHADAITALSFNEYGSTLVAGSVDGDVKYWQLKVVEPIPEMTPVPRDVTVTPLAFQANAFVEIDKSAGLVQEGHSFTAELWFYLPKGRGEAFLCGDFHEGRNNHSGWCIKSRKDFDDLGTETFTLHQLFGTGNGSSSQLGNTPFEVYPGEWHHTALVVNNLGMRLFLDGRLLREAKTVTKRLSSPDNIFLGFKTGQNQALNGKIRAFRLSSVGRYFHEFSPPAVFTSDKHTEVLLDFNGKGDRVLDISGHNRHGLIKGAKWDKPLKVSSSSGNRPQWCGST